ncbi:NAD-dependent epimerase/dehydratase family protein [Thalassorhabdus alkalitolerans]|uniref:UDP-glucose 4-epimerase n=1 Tax=Thalassorhabdus alkalitolerans TaxID=2282697 RepID=A0ABW0YNZ5_9BACI
MKVLVTGGAGFIGSHVVEELLLKGYQVSVVDNLITGKKENLPNGVTFYKVDIRDNLNQIFEKENPDYVIHMAAQVSVSHSISKPVYDGEQNILATINVLKACVQYKVKKIIFASTAAVYGEPHYLPIDEKHEWKPISFYGLSKLNAESYIKMFSELYALNYTILRYANVYGMRQDAHGEAGVVAIFIEKIMKGDRPTIFGDGLQTRDFIFVKDVAKANVAALENGDDMVFNVSTEKKTSVVEIIDEMAKAFNKEIFPQFTEEREGDIRDSYLSNKITTSELGWEPMYTLSEGLHDTISYYKNIAVEII